MLPANITFAKNTQWIDNFAQQHEILYFLHFYELLNGLWQQGDAVGRSVASQ